MRHRTIFLLILLAGSLGLPGAARAQSPQTPLPTLPGTIPIFPLAEITLFPNVSRPLHIFEQRYREMVADALKGDRIIGMVMLQPGFEKEYEGRPPIHAIGCAGYIAEFEQLPDGRYNIVLRGLTKFRVTTEDASRPYRLAHVEALAEPLSDADRASLRVQRERLDNMLEVLGIDVPPATIPDEDVVNALALYLDMDPGTRLELLEIRGALLRAHALIALLETR
jgi:Lon protease-like protein